MCAYFFQRGTQLSVPRARAECDAFNYIEKCHNPKCRHGTAGDASPAEFERRHSRWFTYVSGIRTDSGRVDRGHRNLTRRDMRPAVKGFRHSFE